MVGLAIDPDDPTFGALWGAGGIWTCRRGAWGDADGASRKGLQRVLLNSGEMLLLVGGEFDGAWGSAASVPNPPVAVRDAAASGGTLYALGVDQKFYLFDGSGWAEMTTVLSPPAELVTFCVTDDEEIWGLTADGAAYRLAPATLSAVLAQANSDPDFRRRLISDYTAVFRQLGIAIPQSPLRFIDVQHDETVVTLARPMLARRARAPSPGVPDGLRIGNFGTTTLLVFAFERLRSLAMRHIAPIELSRFLMANVMRPERTTDARWRAHLDVWAQHFLHWFRRAYEQDPAFQEEVDAFYQEEDPTHEFAIEWRPGGPVEGFHFADPRLPPSQLGAFRYFAQLPADLTMDPAMDPTLDRPGDGDENGGGGGGGPSH
jgi:hypothetical protein